MYEVNDFSTTVVLKAAGLSDRRNQRWIFQGPVYPVC